MAEPLTAETNIPADRPVRVLSGYWGLDDASVTSTPQVSAIDWNRRSDCVVARIPARGDKPEAFLKAFRNRETLEGEIRGLELAADTNGPTTVRVPRVLHVARADDGLVMEFVAGPTLAAVERAAMLRPWVQPRYQTWHDLGAWLKSFHSAHELSDDPATFVGENAVQTESFLLGLRGLLGSRAYERLRSLREAVLREAAAQPAPLVLCHGDFALNNLILAPDRVWVTDFAYVTPAPRELDLESLWDSLEDVLGYLPGGNRRIAAIRERFLAGYGPEPLGRRGIADLVRLRLKLQKLYFLSHHVPSSAIRRAWRQYQYDRTLKQLTAWADSPHPEHAV